MKATISNLFWSLAVALSTLWLAGYVRCVLHFDPSLTDPSSWTCLGYPDIKLYKLADPTTGSFSPTQIELFSVADGPTGIEYTQAYFPCWIVSLAALGVLCAGTFSLFSGSSRADSRNANTR